MYLSFSVFFMLILSKNKNKHKQEKGINAKYNILARYTLELDILGK